jgi:hypothetical protein
LLDLDDLLQMERRELNRVMFQAHPMDLQTLENSNYTGVDISLPKLMNRILWKTFRKTFYRDPATGVLRGWNVRVEQTGWDGSTVPMRDKRGQMVTFGHYEVRPTADLKFPGGWQGHHYLDYRFAGNPSLDWTRFLYCPLVAVNAGDSNLLLGWEVIRIGAAVIPLGDYWLLKREGPLSDGEVLAPPRPT